jgi:hypothetical protein
MFWQRASWPERIKENDSGQVPPAGKKKRNWKLKTGSSILLPEAILFY